MHGEAGGGAKEHDEDVTGVGVHRRPSISFTQLFTFFIAQATLMDRTLFSSSSFNIPTTSVSVFAALKPFLIVPLNESFTVPLPPPPHPLPLRPHLPPTHLRRPLHLRLSPRHRRSRHSTAPPTIFWLFPQFFFTGTAEVFAYVGQLEFFYDDATEGTRSISRAMFLSSNGIGSWLSMALVKAGERATGG